MAEGPLTHRIAVVTGAGGGFGQVLARTLAVAGAYVLVVDRDGAGARGTVQQVAAAGGTAEAVTADVTDDAAIDQVLARARELGGPHVLVNNAGGWTPGDAQYPDAGPEEWSRTLDLDLRAPMAWTQRFLQVAGAGDDRVVVTVASSAALGPSPYGSPEYAAAKAGLIRLTTSLADAQERFGVRALCIVPGWIGLERAHAAYDRLSPAERAGTPDLVPPESLAATIVAAVTDAGVVSGTVIHALVGEQVEIMPPGRPCG